MKNTCFRKKTLLLLYSFPFWCVQSNKLFSWPSELEKTFLDLLTEMKSKNKVFPKYRNRQQSKTSNNTGDF